MNDKKNAGLNLPFGATVGDTLDLMRKMWGMTGLPGIPTPSNLAAIAARLPQTLPSMVAPTLDVGELDKRIGDLRAVEQWLALNSGMLRATIQSLEVQRATIATLKGISGAMLSPVMGGGKGAPQQPPIPQFLMSNPAAMGLDPTAPGAWPPMPQAPAVSDEPEEPEEPEAPPPRARAPKKRAVKRKSAAKTASVPHVSDEPLNPAAWWNTLQDQFTKIAAGAVEGAGQTKRKTRKVGSQSEAIRARNPAASTPKARRR